MWGCHNILGVTGMVRILGVLCILSLLSGCVAVSMDKVESIEGFNWDTLKRDLIVMTPVLDLRGDVRVPTGFEKDVAPFTDKQNIDYAEAFKQTFFGYRKDIRVFGAGGAFENISKIPNLTSIAKKVFSKETLPLTEQRLLHRARQDKRFICFFTFSGESLTYEYSVEKPREAKGLYVEKNYDAKRTMVLKMALWDADVGKTVFISEKVLTPTHRNQILVKTGLSPFAVKGDKGRYTSAREPDIYDRSLSSSLETELQVHQDRFPKSFPGREPEFTGSFDDFALTMPIKKSEQNLIEYEYFVFHRPEIAFKQSSMGSKAFPSLFFGTSSIIYNRYRWGVGVDFSSAKDFFKSDDRNLTLERFCLCMTTDLEWELSINLRLMTGTLLGAGSFTLKPDEDSLPAAVDAKKLEVKDGFWYAAPRVKFLLGPKQGLQLGFGAFQQFYSGLVEPQLMQHKPSRWGYELSLSATFRGF